MVNKFSSWLRETYIQLAESNESSRRIALSFAIGVFLGILPFTGILVAIWVAWQFHLNKAAAILGSAITNTWLGLIVLGLAIQIGAFFFGLNDTGTQATVQGLFDNFQWHDFLSLSFFNALLPVAVGYLVLSIVFAGLAYLLAMGALSTYKARRRQR